MTQTTINRQAAEAAYQADRSAENLKALQLAGKAEMDEYLAGFDAREAARSEADEQADQETTAPATEYAAWFTTLLNEREECSDTEAFERAAYSGHIAYELSMTDGYYAPEDFEAWAIGFRKDPISELYYGNDARHLLAPQAYSYLRKLTAKNGQDRWATLPHGRAAHRFDQNNRAVCNWRLIPNAWQRMNNDYRTRQDVVDGGRYLICPRCDEQS